MVTGANRGLETALWEIAPRSRLRSVVHVAIGAGRETLLLLCDGSTDGSPNAKD
jgi:hypothetical protein